MYSCKSNLDRSVIFTMAPYIGVGIGLYGCSNAFIAIFIYHLGIGIAIYLYRDRFSLRELFSLKRRYLLIPCLLPCLLAGPVLYFLWDYMKSSSLDLQITLVRFRLGNISVLPFLCYFSFVHPLIEEGFWRFVRQVQMPAISIDELLFASYHFFVLRFFLRLEYAFFCCLGLVVIARIWRFFRQNLKEGLLILLMHSFADMSIMVCVFYFLVNKPIVQ